MSGNDQWCATTIFEHICHSISERHHDILNHAKETCVACFPSIEMLKQKRSTSQIKEMRISSKESELSRIRCKTTWNSNEFREDQSSQRIININRC